MSAHTSPKNAQCSRCAPILAELRRLVRMNEKRLRQGRPLDIAEMDKRKDELRRCAANGHHDPQAGPAARWHPEAATSP